MAKARWTYILIAGLLSMVIANSAYAQAASQRSYAWGATRKLGRGLANVVSAPFEIIRTPMLVSERDGGVAGVTVGIIQGLWAAAVRELAGIVEAGTFLIPLPKDFEPLLKPEFIYAHGDWVP